MEGRFFEVGRLRCAGVGGEVAISMKAGEVSEGSLERARTVWNGLMGKM